MNVYYPSLWELLILILVVVELIWFGHLFKQRWESKNESVPVPVALLMWCAMVGVYVAVSAIFYYSSPYGADYDPAIMPNNVSIIADGPEGFDRYVELHPGLAEEEAAAEPGAASKPVVASTALTQGDRRLTLLTWLLLFWFIPMGYYISIVVNSVATRTVDRIGPFSAKIDEPSEFAEARRQAIHGDVDGAVAIYRRYDTNRSAALLEAARLLKSEDRFADAAKLYDEIADRFQENQGVWAEASLQLARLLEKNLMNREAAIAMYQQVIERAPQTRFAQAANTDLSRLQILAQMHDTNDTTVPQKEPDPFFDGNDVRSDLPVETDGSYGEEDLLETPVPPSDPFLAARMRRVDESLAAPEAQSNNRPAAKKSATKKPAAAKKPAPKKKTATKPAAKKKTAAKKKAVARKKPTAKKKASSKKPPSK